MEKEIKKRLLIFIFSLLCVLSGCTIRHGALSESDNENGKKEVKEYSSDDETLEEPVESDAFAVQEEEPVDASLIDPQGTTLGTRIHVPEGYERTR